jgi:hypothetical protein
MAGLLCGRRREMSESLEAGKTVAFQRFSDNMLFDEYRLFVEDTARFFDRRQAFSNVMVAMNGLLVAGIYVIVKDVGPRTLPRLIGMVPLLGAGLAASCVWWKVLSRYDDIIRARNGFLKKIECEVGKNDTNGMHLMLAKFHPPGGPKQGFTALEKGLPLIFIGVYSLLAAAVALVGICSVCLILGSCLARLP